MIKINGKIVLKKESSIHYEEIIGQIARDAAYGTYQEFPDVLSKKLGSYDKYVKVENIEPISNEANIFAFDILISQDIFPIKEGGIQHFISTACGDLFSAQMPTGDIEEIEIISIEWEEVKSDNRINVDRIRSEFKLEELEPLMAFTFKPRFG